MTMRFNAYYFILSLMCIFIKNSHAQEDSHPNFNHEKRFSCNIGEPGFFGRFEGAIYIEKNEERHLDDLYQYGKASLAEVDDEGDQKIVEKNITCYYQDDEKIYYCEGKDFMNYIKIDITSEESSQSPNWFGGGLNVTYKYDAEIKYKNKFRGKNQDTMQCTVKKFFY